MTEKQDMGVVTQAHRADDFKGDNAHLIVCIDALLDLDDAKALVPHGVGGKGSHAYRMLCAARHRLASQADQGEAKRMVYDPARDRVIMSSVRLGRWMSAALDDPNVCDEMKADIREWFSAGEPVVDWAAAITRDHLATHRQPSQKGEGDE